MDDIAHDHFDPEHAHHNLRIHDSYHDGAGPHSDYAEWENTEPVERLKTLFPSIDVNSDGSITVEELFAWQYKNGVKMSHAMAKQEFVEYDTDSDGQLTLKEYSIGITGEDRWKDHTIPENFIQFDDWEETSRVHFLLADRNRDLKLAFLEYYDMTYPEEGSNSLLQASILKRDIHGSDGDGDGLLSFEEFQHGIWPDYLLWEAPEEWDSQRQVEQARKHFTLLDKDVNKKLSFNELLPIFDDIHPSESRYARVTAERMVHLGDENGDDVLSLEEVLAHPQVFYSRIREMHEEL